MKNGSQLLWIVFGAVYGLAMRVLYGFAGHSTASTVHLAGVQIVSCGFLLATPFVIGAIVIYGVRKLNPSILQMISAPWLAIGLALVGASLSLLEGFVCIVLAAPLFFFASSLGGVIMGLVLRWSNKGKTTVNSIIALPIMLMLVEPQIPQQPRLLVSRASIDIAASPHVIWAQILNARDIHKEELPASFTHWIGVPRPVEGVNVMMPEGEVRYSKWERGVNFSALVTHKVEDQTITWNYRFTEDSFPPGSLDEHVKIGGRYFDLEDTTFNLVSLSTNLTRLEIISHYRVTTDINFYGVPVAQFIANDFIQTILGLYKFRSERSAI